MADYYSLLARKIGPLRQSTPEGRHAIYELARKALFNQLRAIQPPVAEQVIQNEGRALDEAIARLEIEAAAELRSEAETPAQAAEPQSEAGGARAGSDLRERQRPAAPAPAVPEAASGSRRILGIAAVLFVLVGAVSFAALHFRERPEDLARLKPDESARSEGESGKIADRVDGGDHDSLEGGGANKGPAVPVAQKAELFVATADHPDKVDRIYNGAVVWRLDNIGGGDGQPMKSAIRGDVDFPEGKLKAVVLIQKNLDPALSASHTMNVSFSLAADSDLKGVKQIGPPQMRRPEAQSGEKITGIPVEITSNAFLIGLMRGEAEARNLKLLRAPWVIDLPLQLSDGRVATINLEKGAAGDRVFADAIDSWSR
ncbi:hypothetical protein [Methylocystis heyeri]|uniref:Uncharacterized protein n=1 Tax=Methylocystis heyeri TaxID=391905 RepID=A0A6B8KKH2_9HYPH|nr:hypothetical protein [Methylocystis heyeri]QGM47113.1 hypothetical protein H2LOC_016230 [Methylocystis heyeri]